jgi:hypothetical protein
VPDDPVVHWSVVPRSPPRHVFFAVFDVPGAVGVAGVPEAGPGVPGWPDGVGAVLGLDTGGLAADDPVAPGILASPCLKIWAGVTVGSLPARTSFSTVGTWSMIGPKKEELRLPHVANV